HARVVLDERKRHAALVSVLRPRICLRAGDGPLVLLDRAKHRRRHVALLLEREGEHRRARLRRLLAVREALADDAEGVVCLDRGEEEESVLLASPPDERENR